MSKLIIAFQDDLSRHVGAQYLPPVINIRSDTGSEKSSPGWEKEGGGGWGVVGTTHILDCSMRWQGGEIDTWTMWNSQQGGTLSRGHSPLIWWMLFQINYYMIVGLS